MAKSIGNFDLPNLSSILKSFPGDILYKFRSILFMALSLVAVQAQARPKTLVVISVDGLRPDYITQAEKHGLTLPHLRHFMTDGTYAEGVVGVVPTVTYPSHTTLMTGVWPAEHGIVTNTMFDPSHQNLDDWYRFASEIKVPTLWQTAGDAGIVVASVGWPVTVGAKGVTYLRKLCAGG